ncbi:uncharacterized protein [Nicotiana tomentosiformis]|uniref:uncharacterized protein n=1 Tax=Nicotiana tomentosiformis TaxID=4098 RepID=UPI00388C8B4B
MKRLWEELNTLNAHAQCNCQCTCGAKANMHKAEQDRRLIQFLIGLNEVYTVVKGNILMMNPLPSIAHAFSILIQEEKQREVRPSNRLDFKFTKGRNASSAANVHTECEEVEGRNTGESLNNIACGAANFASILACSTYKEIAETTICKCSKSVTDFTLPNRYRVKVTEIGDAFLGPMLTLVRVLYTPSMKRPLEIGKARSGYPFGVKGYKVLDLATKRVHVSRDVFLHEDVFPFVILPEHSSFPSVLHMNASTSATSSPISEDTQSQVTNTDSPKSDNRTHTDSPITGSHSETHLDVNNAFLHGDLHEEVYMQILQGLMVEDTSLVYILRKSLYGLKWASRQWKLIGKLNFLTNKRLDIAYNVQHLSQFIKAPREPHLKAAIHVLRYLKADPTLGIFLSNVPSYDVTTYCDSDWAACPDSRRFVSGYLVLLGDSPISWKSKKQTTISLSSANAEYMSLRKVVGELVWVKRLLEELIVSCDAPIPVF